MSNNDGGEKWFWILGMVVVVCYTIYEIAKMYA